MRCLARLLTAVVLLASALSAETITTESGHFRVHYPEGARETAKQVAAIAEEVYYQLVTAYDLHEQFRPIDILVTDNIDVGNGFADYYQNQVAVWATNLDYSLRGTHQWLKNVVAHELGHIFSLKLAKRYPFRYGLLSASVINSSVADFGINIPIYSLVTPSWWVEGVAQYESDRYGGDSWDSHRDMLLRMATLEDDLLSYDDMGVFAHNWLKSEMVYNQGFNLCLYIADQWGDEMPRTLARQTGHVTFNTTLRRNLHRSGSRLYKEWADHLRERYGQVARRVGKVVEGTKIVDDGTYDASPVISPDGTRIAYISAGKEDYLLTKPRIRHLAAKTKQEIDERVYGNLAWFPSGDKIIYTKFGRGTLYLDLYTYDIARKKETRITSQLRARDPAVSPDGEWVAFVQNEDGGTRLGMVRSDGSEIRWLTNSQRSPDKPGASLASKTNSFIQFYSPRWSPDGDRLLFSVFDGDDRDIGVIGTQGPYFDLKEALEDSAAFPDTLAYPNAANFKLLIHSTADERDPAWLPDGSGFLYSADYDGIFNIYRYRFSEEPGGAPTVTKVTNVLGGAFSPDVSPDGTWLSYVGYHANNFSIYSLPLNKPAGPAQVAALPPSVERDYQHIEKTPTAKQLFRVGPTYGLRTLVGWVPTIRFGPNFIGDQFSVSQLGAGVAVGIEDQAHGRYYFGNAEYTKNIERKDPPSTSVLLYAEQGLTPILTTESGIAPNLYVYGARYQLGTTSDRSRTLAFTPPSQIDVPGGEAIPVDVQQSNVTITDTLTSWDTYTYYYGGTGITFALGGGFGAGMELSWQRYRLEELTDRKITNLSTLRDARDPNADVTTLFPWGQFGYPQPGPPRVWDKRPQFNIRYFNDRTATLSWGYRKITPTVDMMVNPTGGRAFRMAYTFHTVTLTDSLAGVNFNDVLDPLDPAEPLYASVPRRQTINEVVLSYQELIRMPGFLRRTTLNLLGIVGYQDQPFKYYDAHNPSLNLLEGWAYWPLRYRLGGGGALRGYPYFTLEGSKMAYFRATYVFPLIPHYGVQFLSFFHDRTYGALFAEAGAVWNWDRLQDAKIYRDDWLWDIGFEIRMSAFTFYRLPMQGYFSVARRMSDVPPPFIHNIGKPVTDEQGRQLYSQAGQPLFDQPGRLRLYLGVSVGLGGGSGGSAPGTHFSSVRMPDVPRGRRNALMTGYGTSAWEDAWSPVAGTPRVRHPAAR